MREVERVPQSEYSEELQQVALAEPAWKKKKHLSKQLSMCGTPGDIAWERRRRQIHRQERRRNSINDSDDLTDEDLHELRGCIELGFGFNEEDGQTLCNTLPALDLYFAVTDSCQLALYPHLIIAVHPLLGALAVLILNLGKICSPGDDPAHVKTKLRHWAQAVACSVMQSH
ncbi:hypothetical protein SESBI_19370 [Sesbania bispinosa]|nr:hypothetical protein SESBI_19370 [Sesbania bispinosa]